MWLLIVSCVCTHVFSLPSFTGSLQWAQPTTSGDPPRARYAHSCVLIGTSLVIFGGCCSRTYQNSLNDVHVFNLDRHEWTQPSVKGDVPAPRHGHSATHIGDGVMLIFGGANEDESLVPDRLRVLRFNDAFILDTSTYLSFFLGSFVLSFVSSGPLSVCASPVLLFVWFVVMSSADLACFVTFTQKHGLGSQLLFQAAHLCRVPSILLASSAVRLVCCTSLVARRPTASLTFVY